MFSKQISFFIVLLMLIFASCSDDASNVSMTKEQAEVEVAENIEILYSDSAVLRVKIKSDTLLHYTNLGEQKDVFPAGVRLDFFDNFQKPQSILTSKYGVRYPEKGEVILTDSCVWHSLETKEKLEAFELIWDEKLQKIYSNKLVIITTPTEKIWGYGFETNSDFTRWKINVPQGHLSVDKVQ
jgi:LPS export ABC transporter protein LptC